LRFIFPAGSVGSNVNISSLTPNPACLELDCENKIALSGGGKAGKNRPDAIPDPAVPLK
jgi:hypothetical protein